MINIDFRTYKPTRQIDKNILYKIEGSCSVEFVEQHDETREVVDVEYNLNDNQYGIYANEYRRPGTRKDGCKAADVLSCIVEQNKKEIKSLVFDVKSNISAFSDDLSKSVALLTAIKSVRDFIEQIRAEILHKESFLLYYKAEGYVEQEEVGIVTTNFEPEKFREVAKRLNEIMTEDQGDVPPLIFLKLKNSLKPYEHEGENLCNFADKKIVIGEKMYQLQVFLLSKVNEFDYRTTINMSY